jgi:hypothetical protein
MQDCVGSICREGEQHVAVAPRVVEPVVGKERHSDEFARMSVCEPVPIVEQRRADGDRGLHRHRHCAEDTGVGRWHRRIPIRRIHTLHQELNRRAQVPERLSQLGPIAGQDVEAGGQRVRVSRRRDARLGRAVEAPAGRWWR